MNDSLAPGATPRIWIAFTIMCLGMFMAILDIQIVTTSLPAIRAALRIAPDQMVWIQTAYLTAEIVAIPLTGYLTRLLGMRWLFVSAISLFTLASAACAASNGFAPLIAARIVQGFAGGTLIPAVFSAVFLLFPERQQSLATTLAGVAAVLAPTLGPVVGGWITQTYSWHWLFLVNVVPGVIAALAAARLLRTAAAPSISAISPSTRAEPQPSPGASCSARTSAVSPPASASSAKPSNAAWPRSIAAAVRSSRAAAAAASTPGPTLTRNSQCHE